MTQGRVHSRWEGVVALAGAILFVAAGCSTQQLGVRAMAPTMRDLLARVNDQPDPQLVRDGVPSNLLLLDGLASIDPGNEDMATLTARAFCSYALIFVMDEDRDRAKLLFEQGRAHALRALDGEYKDFAKAADEGDLESFGKAVAKVEKGDIAPLFWFGNCWAGAINSSKGSAKALVSLPKVEKVMQQAVKLDETYYFAGPRLFMGMYYASRPKALGGNPDESRKNFERAIELTDGHFLMTKVFEAQYYAVMVQDRDLFQSLLEGVLAAPDDVEKGQNLATRVAKEKAKKLLADADSLF
jgi:hypothetical protein